MPTTRTYKQLVGLPEHKPEIAVLDTIRTADDLLGHSFPHSFPLQRTSPDVGWTGDGVPAGDTKQPEGCPHVFLALYWLR